MTRSTSLIRQIIDAFRHVRGGQHGARPGGRVRWPQCPACFRRVPEICADAEEGAEPCQLGMQCGCCYGPHRVEERA